MNQIISKFKKNKEVQNSNIVPKILLIPIIILFIIILSYKIYSVASSNQKDEQRNMQRVTNGGNHNSFLTFAVLTLTHSMNIFITNFFPD